ncbi:MAG TPA: LysE family transporter [Methanoregulaceae archaeon]|nr:LysE family transporter [Methanoregulaceae archaeon]
MYTLPEILTIAFAIGLTGALSPGPTLIATIRSSLRYGWIAGPAIVTGHVVVEFCIFILIITGIAAVAGEYSWVIAGVGGIVLVLFGLMTIAESRTATLSAIIADQTDPDMVSSPSTPGTGTTGLYPVFLAGIVTSVSNPYFWIWWVSIGSAMVIDGLKSGLILGSAFMIGHWCADISWYTVVSSAIHHGKAVLSDRSYRLTIALCGIFLVFFGIWFFIAAFSK